MDRAVAQAVDQIEESIANLRALITDLRPAALDEIGVQAALEALAERSQRHGIEVDVSIQLAYEQGLEPTRLSGELETALVSDHPGGADERQQARAGDTCDRRDSRGRR